MKRTDGHSLESVAISVAFFAIVVCTLAAHGDSLSGGPANVGSSQASTQNSSSASTQSQSEAITNGSRQSGNSVKANSNSGFADSTHSAATVQNTELKAVPLNQRPSAGSTTKTYVGKSRGEGIRKSSAWMTREINSVAKPQRRLARRGSKRNVAMKTHRANKTWKTVNYK